MQAFWSVITYELLEDKHKNNITINNILLICYTKQRDSMLVQICMVITGYVKMWWSISDATYCDLVCHFKILTTFCHKLWSITEQKYSNMESIC